VARNLRTTKCRGYASQVNTPVIKYAVVSAKIELKSVTTQRITFVFSQIAHELAKCILKKDIPPNCFINPGVAKVEDAADPRRQG